jgi:hypothetical protein
MGASFDLGTSPLQMMDESDGESSSAALPFPTSPSPPPPPMLGVSAEWDSSFLPWEPRAPN